MTCPQRTDYKYIVFRTDSIVPSEWVCMNRRADASGKVSAAYLGRCAYHKPWRCWIFQASGQAIWSNDCLTDIAEFLKQLNATGAPK